MTFAPSDIERRAVERAGKFLANELCEVMPRLRMRDGLAALLSAS